MMKFLRNKKGTLGLDNVPSVAISFVVIATIFVVGYLVLAGLQQPTTTVAGNTTNAAINNLTTGMNRIIEFAPTWGTVIGAAVILAIVVGGLYFFMKRQS